MAPLKPTNATRNPADALSRYELRGVIAVH
jgi:hypothetical protein